MAVSLAELRSGGPDSECAFHYLKRSGLYAKEKPFYFSGTLEIEQEDRRSNLEYEVHDGIKVRDLREHQQALSLKSHGFELLRHTPTVDLLAPSEDIIYSYLEELVETVKEHLGAEAVFAYNYRFRREQIVDDSIDVNEPMGSFTNQDKPVLVPHTDQSREGGLRRVRRHLSEEEAMKYLNGDWRVRILNSWRPLGCSADERPLAMCDFTSIDEDDLRAADRASREYVGEIYYVHHNPDQRWYWISGQMPDEMLLFVNFDSSPGLDVPFMVHSSFVNKSQLDCPKRRQSLEVALIVISRK